MTLKAPKVRQISDPPDVPGANVVNPMMYGPQDRLSSGLRRFGGALAKATKVYLNQYDLKMGSNLVKYNAPFKPRGRRILSQSTEAVLFGDQFGKDEWQVNATMDVTVLIAWERNP